MTRRPLAVVAFAASAALAVLAVVGDVTAVDADPVIIGPSAAFSDTPAPAIPMPVGVDMVAVYETGELSPALKAGALAAARAVGAPAVIERDFTGWMTRLRRGTTVLQQARAAGWVFPMGVTALPLDAVAATMGRRVAAPLALGEIVMGQTSATVHHVKVGDVVEMQNSAGHTVSFRIGQIQPDAVVGGTELLMSIDEAGHLGATVDDAVIIYGASSRTALMSAIRARGLLANPSWEVEESWGPPSPDSTLGLAQTKALLGEFDFDLAHLSSSGWTAMSPQWRAKYLPAARELYPTGISAMCNNVMKADLRAALTEVVASGLGSLIDVGNTNHYGGCATGSVRMARVNQAMGAISRHSWGQPIDMNTVSNCEGCTPGFATTVKGCELVRIFRKHGFAWGGNFLTPDGMHFEWVGQARNTLIYPSRYCPNLAGGAIKPAGTGGGMSPSSSTSPASGVVTARATMFDRAGLVD